MSSKRATKAHLAARRQAVQELILEGHTRDFIVKRVAKEWKTSDRAIQEDIRMIGDLWSQRAPEEAQKMRNKYEERLELMFKKAFGMGQFKTALEIQKEIHKIGGLYKEKEENKEKAPEFITLGKKGQLRAVNTDEGSDESKH